MIKIDFKLGDIVIWNSSANGKTKKQVGTIVEIVAANNRPDPKRVPMFRKGRQLGTRSGESYVVEVDGKGGKKEYLWPLVSKLALGKPVDIKVKAKGGGKPVTNQPANKHSNKHTATSKKTTTVVEEVKADGTVIKTTVEVIEPGKLDTDWIICLDSSGSMESCRDGAIKAFNAEVEAVKNAAATAGLRVPRVTLWTFGVNSGVRCDYYRIPADKVKPLSRDTYVPDGGTPMFDCIGDAIDKHLADREVKGAQNLAVVLRIITDGQDTGQKRHTATQVVQMFDATSSNWTHVFMVPKGGYKAQLTSKFKVPAGNILEWDATARGIEVASMATQNAVSQYMGLRSSGTKSVNNFYVQPDLSKLTAADLAKLTDLSKHFKVYTVDQEAEIKPFIEGKTGKTYVIGSAYYQLSKSEKKVHKHKNILLRDKFTKKIFGGVEARKLIGLPIGVEAKVEPGNHANFDIFIESTSVNRKLVRGSLLLHDVNQVMDKIPTWDHLAAYSTNGTTPSA